MMNQKMIILLLFVLEKTQSRLFNVFDNFDFFWIFFQNIQIALLRLIA